MDMGIDIQPIRTTRDVAAVTDEISDSSKAVEDIHAVIFGAYEGSREQMGVSRDLSEFAMKLDGMLDEISAMAYAISDFGSTVSNIQKVYGDTQERAIARAMLLPR